MNNFLFLSMVIAVVALLLYFVGRICQSTNYRSRSEGAGERPPLPDRAAKSRINASEQYNLSEEVGNMLRRKEAGSKTFHSFSEMLGVCSPLFYAALQRHAAPERLSETDLKYCACLYVRMSNGEMAKRFAVSTDTVKTHKTKLKRKLRLTPQENLQKFLWELE